MSAASRAAGKTAMMWTWAVSGLAATILAMAKRSHLVAACPHEPKCVAEGARGVFAPVDRNQKLHSANDAIALRYGTVPVPVDPWRICSVRTPRQLSVSRETDATVHVVSSGAAADARNAGATRSI